MEAKGTFLHGEQRSGLEPWLSFGQLGSPPASAEGFSRRIGSSRDCRAVGDGLVCLRPTLHHGAVAPAGDTMILAKQILFALRHVFLLCYYVNPGIVEN